MRLLDILGAALAGVMMTGCAGEAVSTPGPGRGADQIAFMVMTHGGMLPSALYAMESPELVIYRDGRVLTIAKDTELQMVPARYEVAHVDPAAVTSFVSNVQGRGVVAAGTDFGTPRVADAPVTTVLLGGAEEQVQVDPYALAEQFDRGLTDGQRGARSALRTIIDQAQALTAGAARTPYSPERIVVYEIEARPGADAATVRWPGPPPSSFLHPSQTRRSIACGELVADPAGVVYRAALNNPGASWLVDGTTRVLAVNPLPLPGSCD